MLAAIFCFELDWDVRLLLAADEVPPLTLGRSGRLGWTTWLGRAGTERPTPTTLCLRRRKRFVGRAEYRAA